LNNPRNNFSRPKEPNHKEAKVLSAEAQEEEDRKKRMKEIEMLKSQIEESKMKEDEIKRATNTIFMTSIPLKATEKDIYAFIKVNGNC
jgi:RNA recognition motif-containing protein